MKMTEKILNRKILNSRIKESEFIRDEEKEIIEDYDQLAGLTGEEDINEPVGMSVRKRMPWLIILLGLGLVVSSVVGAFESVVASLTIIISFQSLILDMAGNAGTQSLAVTIRVLTNEELDRDKKLKFISKEI